jgi:hypothetical protein
LRGRDAAADTSALQCLTIGKIDLFGLVFGDYGFDKHAP